MPDPTAAEREALGKARQAEAAADKAELELADLRSPDGVLARAAKNRQAAAEADKAAAAAQQAQIGAMIPDLSKVKESSLSVAGGGALGGSGLTFGCLDDAAAEVAKKVNPPGKTQWRILVTSDADLASADTVHSEVAGGLKTLATAASDLLDETATPKKAASARDRSTDGDRGVVADSAASAAAGAGGLAAAPIVGAAAAAIPAIMSLLSAERSLTMSTVTVSDLAAAAAVASKLIAKSASSVRVMHDDFRLVPASNLYDEVSALATQRTKLVGRRLELATRRSTLETDMKDGSTPEQQAELAQIVAGAGLVEALIAAIDGFMSGIRTVPAGGRRTPLATASLYDALHDASDKGLTHVLLVKAQPAQSTMLTDDKALWFADKFSTLVEVSVTYMLVGTDVPWLLGSGTVTAMTMAHGRMGDRITFEDRVPVTAGNGQHEASGAASSGWSVVQMRIDRTSGDD